MPAPGQKSANYLEVQVQTASKEQLLLMLFDGALRFCEQARLRMEVKDFEGTHANLMRAKAIVVELMCTLDKNVGTDVYKNLIGLYNFVYMRLVESNLRKSPPLLGEAVEILVSLRETWKQAIDKLLQEGQQRSYSNPARSASNFSITG